MPVSFVMSFAQDFYTAQRYFLNRGFSGFDVKRPERKMNGGIN